MIILSLNVLPEIMQQLEKHKISIMEAHLEKINTTHLALNGVNLDPT